IRDKTPSEAIRTITEFEPEKPTAVVRNRAPSGMEKTKVADIPVDLDAIVAKAMRKDAQQRYASAQELSSDVSRCLLGLPVLAHKGSFRYVAGKFVARHRFAVLGLLGATLLAVVGVAGVLWQARIAQRERERAQRRFDQVHSLAKSLIF